MPAEIKCPKCGNEFEPNDAIREEVKRELRLKAADWEKAKAAEFSKQLEKKDLELQQQLHTEKNLMRQQLEENLRKSITNDFENKLHLLESSNRTAEEKLKEARSKELELLKQQQEFQTREAELDITIQKQVQQQREKLVEEIRRIEDQKHQAKETEQQLLLKEKDKQLQDQIELMNQMKRKAEQGSMQLQGEVQELALEELLRAAFPFDLITEVGKGVRGADCIQVVRNSHGQECGKIIFESKRAANFSNEWIEKLRTDMRSQGADVAVLVSQILPRDMSGFGEKNGVWLCSFAEVKAMVCMLRDGIIKVSAAVRKQDNKGEKMHMLYDYLTSSEFAEQWKAIREGFMSMKISIQKERDTMEKLWKAREKSLEKVLLNAAHVRGSIEGIAGMESVDLNLIDAPNEDDMAH